jgi:hypothetical protein
MAILFLLACIAVYAFSLRLIARAMWDKTKVEKSEFENRTEAGTVTFRSFKDAKAHESKSNMAEGMNQIGMRLATFSGIALAMASGFTMNSVAFGVTVLLASIGGIFFVYFHAQRAAIRSLSN